MGIIKIIHDFAAWADIVIDMVWRYLPHIVISLLVGMFAGIKYYEYSNRKR